jgi:hypothetical protein
MFADKPWLYFQNLFQEENKLPEKNITRKTVKVSENSKNDIRTTHFMTENKFELQSYFILYLLFVRILNLSKDIVSYSFKELRSLFFCFMLIFTKEYWNLMSYLTFKNRKYRTRTSNRIVHKSKNLLLGIFQSFNSIETTRPFSLPCN